MGIPVVSFVTDVKSAGPAFDAVVHIVNDIHKEGHPFGTTITRAAEVDARVGKTSPVLLVDPEVPGKRLIVVGTGPLNRDYDDVRQVGDASARGVACARDAGAKRILLSVGTLCATEEFAQALEVALLAAMHELSAPLEAREYLGEKEAEPVVALGFLCAGDASQKDGERVVRVMTAVEAGRRLARDVGGPDPERMCPMRAAEYIQESFKEHDDVIVKIVEDTEEFKAQYPLAAAVARASLCVPRHKPCIIRLDYTPKEKIEQTLIFAGKGIVYDTGGADLKVGGGMAGMSRDKGGAAAVAGFVKTVAMLKPKGLRVVAELGMVRNSIGSDCYVPDEIIKGHAGLRVRIGNTDAEGRLVMADLLSHLRADVALTAPNPRMFTVATLTGHAVRAAGPYSIALDNGPARRWKVADSIQKSGELWGDPFEVSRLRREDYAMVKARTAADDVLSSNTLPSSVTSRGHQFPMAFLTIASGLSKHGLDSEKHIAYTHLDIAGSSVERMDIQHGKPTGSPIVALTALFVLDRLV